MQTLLIKTNIHCPPTQLEYRRKDIITQAIDVLGRDGAHDLFHNHQGEKAVHRYPLIQYRVHGNKLHLFAVGKGVDALLSIVIGAELDNRAHRVNLNNVVMTKGMADMKPSKEYQYYRLMDWIALNNETFNKEWKQCFSLVERAKILDRAITGHLRRMNQVLNEDNMDALADMDGELFMITARKPMKIYGNTLMGLNVIFKAKAYLPEDMALGRCISLGAGTFQRLRESPENNKKIISKKPRKKSIILGADNDPSEEIIAGVRSSLDDTTF